MSMLLNIECKDRHMLRFGQGIPVGFRYCDSRSFKQRKSEKNAVSIKFFVYILLIFVYNTL